MAESAKPAKKAVAKRKPATAKKAPARKSSKSAEDGTGRQTLRQRQRSLTREALLAGAAEAFAESGYNDVTIDGIAERAGTSRGTFYLYFTKGQILAELIEDAFMTSIGGDAYSALFADLASAAPYTVDTLETWLKGYISTWQDNKPLVRAWMEGDVTDPEVREITSKRIARAVKVLTDLIVDEQRRLGVDADIKAMRARATLMDLQLQYFCFHVVVRGLEVDLEAGVRAMAEQWYSALHLGPDGVQIQSV